MKVRIDRSKLRKLERSTNPFYSLARSIIYQQISTAAGNSINKKFLALFGRKKVTPKTFLTFTEAELKSAGLSPQKRTYLKDLAEKFLDKTVDPHRIDDMSDDEIRAHLVQVKGIGTWTADMFLIFALNRVNVLPLGDLGIRKGFQKVFKLKKIPNEKRMLALAKPFAGMYTEFSLFLWYSIDGN